MQTKQHCVQSDKLTLHADATSVFELVQTSAATPDSTGSLPAITPPKQLKQYACGSIPCDWKQA